MEKADRFNLAFQYLRGKGIIHSQKDLAVAMQSTPPNISSALKGDEKVLTDRFLRRFNTAFDDVFDIDWLLYGEGDMLRPEAEESDAAPVSESYYEDDVPEKYMSYLVPMAAMGGSLIGFEDEGVRKADCERVISPIANADWVVPVCGDSMEPEYPNGSRVYVRQISPNDFIAWGNVFVLDTTNGIIIKVVNKSDREDCVRCESLNPSGRYAPFDVPMRSIRAMYRVLLCVSVK